MPFLLILASALASVIYAADGPLDVSKLKVGPATTVAELDLGKLKGDLQQICWSPDGTQLAWAQKTARRKYMLMIATVTP